MKTQHHILGNILDGSIYSTVQYLGGLASVVSSELSRSGVWIAKYKIARLLRAVEPE